MTKIQRNELTQERVKELFTYSDGILYWNIDLKNGIVPGTVAGCIHFCKTCYRWSIKIDDKNYLRARVVFLYHNGYLPEFVDHEDRNSENDDINNLRPATRVENNRNVSAQKGKSSKYKGVRHQKLLWWVARITVSKNTIHIGTFQTEELAALAYNRKAVELFGEFASLNIVHSIH